MESTFKKKVEEATSVTNYLPIFHTTDGFGFRAIMKNMTLNLNNCEVFENKKLLYSFYGKPAYRKHSRLNYYDVSRLPVTLMIRLPLKANIHKIFPFDSGAFKHLDQEFKEKYFHPKNELNDFNLGTQIEILKKLVNVFYGTNENYLSETPKPNIDEFTTTDFELNSYYNLIKDKSANIFDDRVKVFEVSFDSEIELTKKNLIKIFLPNQFLADEEFKNKITRYIPIRRIMSYYASSGTLGSYHQAILAGALDSTKEELLCN